MSARLADIAWPDFGPAPSLPPPLPREEFLRRLLLVRERMDAAGLTHLAVYADREHFAHLAWLTGFDPRFEEALLLLPLDGKPLLLAGNECMGYLPVSPLHADGDWRVERYQPFSLPDQPRDDSRALPAILASEDIGPASRVGVVGWKTYGRPDAFDLPAYLADALRAASPHVTCATKIVLDLRQTATALDIAWFEYANHLASSCMRRVLCAAREGATDFEMLAASGYDGFPLSVHMTLKTGNNRISLASARGERARLGDRFSCGIGFRGANCCRVGWIAHDAPELPPAARDYVEAYAGPYLEAMAAWFSALRLDATGADLHEAIQSRFPVFLNAGHLLHLEEWLSSPVYAGSREPLRSGMIMQSDVIPSHPVYYSARMEDSYALADASLQSELAGLFPGVLSRANRRRTFMAEAFGLSLSPDVLPLSDLAGRMTPFVLSPTLTLSLKG